MKKQTPKHISKFEPGQIITRIEPAILYEKIHSDLLGEEVVKAVGKDNSFIGEPLEYITIVNACIYVKFKDGSLKGRICKLEYTNFQNGWAQYIDPKTLEKHKEKSTKSDLEIMLKDFIWN